MAGCEAMQGQKGIHTLSPDSTLMFLHMRGKLTASLAHTGVGALRARDAVHDVQPSLRWKGALHMHQCFLDKFCWLVGDGEVIRSKIFGY